MMIAVSAAFHSCVSIMTCTFPDLGTASMRRCNFTAKVPGTTGRTAISSALAEIAAQQKSANVDTCHERDINRPPVRDHAGSALAIRSRHDNSPLTVRVCNAGGAEFD